jgi:hypothetical protein
MECSMISIYYLQLFYHKIPPPETKSIIIKNDKKLEISLRILGTI